MCRCCAVVDGCAIPSFHIDAFILKSTLMAEWNTEKEFDLLKTDFSQNPGTFYVLFRHHEFYSLVSFHYICKFRTNAGQHVAVHALNRLTI